uniref:Olfactory receptor n=1 Tax=Ursus maritimus TaxID=29073 RepID=A0A452UVH0_URSMA
MSAASASILNTSIFILMGFPGLDQYYPWLSIPFSSIYAMVFLGNCLVLHVIRTEPSLHQPMFYFLAMLALTDLCMGLSTVHTVLGILWGLSQEIGLDACISQTYFVHSLSGTESGVLLAMAFDRFTAICDPLRYTSILTNSRVSHVMGAILMRSALSILPVIIRLKFFHYCRPHILSHSFCLHQDLLRLACSDIRFNSFYALALVICILLLDAVLILISYVFILHTVLAIASREERLKSLQTCVSHILDSLGILLSYAFILHSVVGIASQRGKLKALNTCASHICAVLILYVPMIGLSLVHRFAKHSSPLVHITMANIYLLVPPVLNPIIYGIKTKQIRQGFLRILAPKRVGLAYT